MTNMKAFDLQYGKRVQGNRKEYTNCYMCAVLYSNSYCKYVHHNTTLLCQKINTTVLFGFTILCLPLAIQVTFHPYRTLRQELVHPKDPVPANGRKGVVYSIPCAEYIGQTGRSLDYRLREHCRAQKNGDLGSSALAEHVFSSNHQVDLSKAMVIDTHNHTQTRCMLESWHIQHHQSRPQQGEGHLARTLCCTTDLTVHPSGVIPFLCCYYY